MHQYTSNSCVQASLAWHVLLVISNCAIIKFTSQPKHFFMATQAAEMNSVPLPYTLSSLDFMEVHIQINIFLIFVCKINFFITLQHKNNAYMFSIIISMLENIHSCRLPWLLMLNIQFHPLVKICVEMTLFSFNHYIFYVYKILDKNVK